jgi:hypothetical protein
VSTHLLLQSQIVSVDTQVNVLGVITASKQWHDIMNFGTLQNEAKILKTVCNNFNTKAELEKQGKDSS